ncbi:MAG: hypothetical protein HOH43_14345 [Candidatus Latescibacteria bacterium]|jgi:hypothetical protein|nr:hypothetical protein [Candidatus Latescibacterota bacterium]
MSDIKNLPRHDVDILRQLAECKVEIAEDSVNLERRRLWYLHDAGGGGRPMVLAETQGVQDAVLPLPESVLQCEDAWARSVEKTLRLEIYRFRTLGDDHVVEPYFTTNWKVNTSNYGAEVVLEYPENHGHLTARRWDPPIQDLDRDFHKLAQRTFSVDRESTQVELSRLEHVFASILPVCIRGSHWWTMGMTWTAIELIGMENMMLYMYDNPEGLHRLMKFLRDDHLAYASWLEKEGLLNLNNQNDYIGSGSTGYTHDLPLTDQEKRNSVRMRDQWVLVESQETVGVGPDQFEEFVFPYQLSIAEQFGKCYYGCCEPVHSRIEILKDIPNLARVSVSPWADEAYMAESLKSDIVYSRKSNPTLISTEVFNEDAIRADLRHTLNVAHGCRVELIMKDVHTLNNQPERLPRWVEIAREVIDEVA